MCSSSVLEEDEGWQLMGKPARPVSPETFHLGAILGHRDLPGQRCHSGHFGSMRFHSVSMVCLDLHCHNGPSVP